MLTIQAEINSDNIIRQCQSWLDHANFMLGMLEIWEEAIPEVEYWYHEMLSSHLLFDC